MHSAGLIEASAAYLFRPQAARDGAIINANGAKGVHTTDMAISEEAVVDIAAVEADTAAVSEAADTEPERVAVSIAAVGGGSAGPSVGAEADMVVAEAHIEAVEADSAAEP